MYKRSKVMKQIGAPPNWRDWQVNSNNYNLWFKSQAEISTGTSAMAEKSGRLLRNFWRLRVNTSNSKKKLQENLVIGEPHSFFYGFYLLDINQILTVNIREKSPYASSKDQGNEPIWKTPEHTVLLNKVCPQGKLFDQNLNPLEL